MTETPSFEDVINWLPNPRTLILRKAEHIDRFAPARRERSKSIGKRAARRDSFRAYWREHGAEYLAAWPWFKRQARRRRALEMWHEEKRGRAEAVRVGG